MKRRRRYLMVDRVFKGVGRIHRSLETTEPAVAKQRKTMLDTLSDFGKIDILKAIQSGRLSISQVEVAHKRNKIDELPAAEALETLREAVDSWLAQGHGSRKPIADATRDGYRQVWYQALNSSVFGDSPTVADVTADNVEGFRRELLKQGHAPQANRFWFAARSFLGETLGKRHPQLFALQDLNKYPETLEIRPTLTPEGFWALHDASDELLQPALLTMALSGMMPSEYERLRESHFHRKDGFIQVPGQKTAARRRKVGFPEWAWDTAISAVPWNLDRSKFQKLVVAAAKKGGVPDVRPYDLRHAYGQWLEDLGVPMSRVKAYLGHGIKSMTDLYLRHEVVPHMKKDANKLGNRLLKAREKRRKQAA
jgi:integrase